MQYSISIIMMKSIVCVCLLFCCLQVSVCLDCSVLGACEGEGAVNGSHREAVYGYDGVDLCILVSGGSSMTEEHLWLQTLVILLEENLSSLGLQSNRYCLLQFGGTGRSPTHRFLPTADRMFLTASDFVLARRRLSRREEIADGYEAIQYALSNVVFREDPRISKLLLLVTDSERSNVSSIVNKDSLLTRLKDSKLALNAIVDLTLSLSDATLLGLHNGGTTVSALTQEGQDYNLMDASNVGVASSHDNIIDDYVTLAIDSGGSAWPLAFLSQSNLTVQQTFVKALVTMNNIRRTVTVCEECECVEVSGRCALRDCVEASDQETCHCLAQRPASECLSPTPVTSSTDEAIAAARPQPTATPRPLFITGTVDQFPDGDVELTFSSTINRASYECLLLSDDTDTPQPTSCISPVYFKGLPSGHHQLLIIGRRRHSVGTRLFDFTLATPHDEISPQLTLTTSANASGSVRVDTQLYGFPEGVVSLHCSLAGGPFYQCGSSEQLSGEVLSNAQSLFVVVAIGNRGVMAVGSVSVERPVTRSRGPVMVTIATIDTPDPFGRIRLRYNTSRSDVFCGCRVVGGRPVDCSAMEYLADPRELGAGDHTLSISCMDGGGYVDTKTIKLSLSLPPTPPPGQLSCEVRVNVEGQQLIASYACDRRVLATCQVSSLQQESCNSPSGVYVIDVSALGGGPHVFILCVDDGFGKTLMKIRPFVIGTASRRCCPLINSTASYINTSLPQQPQLFLSVASGNCSLTEGFSYSVAWGDGSMDSGTVDRLAPLITSHRYEGGEQESYVVEASYCNSPSIEEHICCSSLSLLTEPH